MNQAIVVACLMAQASPHAGVDADSKKQDLPVRLLPGAVVTTTSELEDSLTQSWASARQITFTVRTDKKRRWTKIGNCSEMNKVDARAAETRPADALGALNAASAWCRALRAIPRAKPSKQTFLADVLAAKNPGAFIPASVADKINGIGPEQTGPGASKVGATHASISWATMDPSVTVDEVQRNDSIRLNGSNWVGSVRYYATGDFNGDGIEDVLLQVSIRPFDASQGDAAFFIMTRTKPQGLLSVIETFR